MRSLKWLFLFVCIGGIAMSLKKPENVTGQGGGVDIEPLITEVNELVIGPPIAESKVNWLSLNQVQDSLRINRKPILIDLYTEWCGWCKVMDKKTYANKNVAEYLQRKFYSVKLDAETRKEINWKGKRYFFNPGYKTNDFSIYLTGGQLSYPTTVIIPADNGDPQAIPGYLEPKDFELIVKYFGDGKYGNVPFEEYRKKFKATW